MLRFGFRWAMVAVCLLLFSLTSWSQEETASAQSTYNRKNTYTMFAEYSPTSSHIAVGYERNRIIVSAGGSYSRRLLKTKNTAISYVAEIQPVKFLADPIAITDGTSKVLTGPDAGLSNSYSYSSTVSKCERSSGSGIYGFEGPSPEEFAYAYRTRCGWRWTFAQAFVPLGVKYSFRTRKKLQPFWDASAGYMYSSRPVPDENSSPFNYIFDLGAGLELFRTNSRSVALEARYQHYSNKDTAPSNYGVDSVIYRMSYSFGR